MSFPTATFEMAAKDTQLMLVMKSFMAKAHTNESFEFYFSKEGNEGQYNRYIKENAPLQVNISHELRHPLDAAAEREDWAAMTADLKAAKAEVSTLAREDILMRFTNSDDYKRWAVQKFKQASDEGAQAITALARELRNSRELPALKATMLIVEGGRTPTDRKKAYETVKAMLRTPARADAIFKSVDLTIPR